MKYKNMINFITKTIQHIQELPERNFERLKAKEAQIKADKVEKPKETAIVQTTFSDRLISGNLNYPKFFQERGGERRYYIYAVPNLFASSLTSLIAVPGIIIRTAYSALMIFKNIWSQGFVDATDPFLENSLNLCSAIKMILSGIVYGTAKLAASLFRDSYKLYQEKQETLSNPNGNVALIGIGLQEAFNLKGNFPVLDKQGNILFLASKLIEAANTDKKNVIVLIQNWHSKNHKSFAVNSGWPQFSKAMMPGIEGEPQDLLPAHAIQGTKEAEFLNFDSLIKTDFIVKQGLDDFVATEGAFWDQGKKHSPLHELLQGRNVKKLIVFGIPIDFSVFASIKQARELGYEVALVKNASDPYFMKGMKFFETMSKMGVKIVYKYDVTPNGHLKFPSYILSFP